LFNEIPTEDVRARILKYVLKDEKVRHKIIGFSHCGRTIDSLEIGNSCKKILFSACYHGMEWITYLLLMKFLKEISSKKKYLNHTITFIPCVNPDGVEISINGADAAKKYKNLVYSIGKTKKWQANARGVDINHNFDADWYKLKQLEIDCGIHKPSNTRYGGEYPESENETKAIANICKENNFIRAFAFHSQGEEIYWRYNEIPEGSEDLAKLMSKLSGYKISDPEGLAVGGGFKDWFIKVMKKPAFTIEVGKGENPLPIKDLKSIYRKIRNMMLIAAGIDNLFL